jgi:hypothetical protein
MEGDKMSHRKRSEMKEAELLLSELPLPMQVCLKHFKSDFK